MKLISSLALALTLISISFAQSSNDLKSKYGKPVEETFKLNPNLYLKSQYDEKGEACEISIIEYYDQMVEPQTMPFSHENEIDKIIGDLAPLRDRGKLVKNDGGIGNCIDFQFWEYENVHIFRDNNLCTLSSQKMLTRVKIKWKNRKCVHLKINRRPEQRFELLQRKIKNFYLNLNPHIKS